jgi:hypothetical protein
VGQLLVIVRNLRRRAPTAARLAPVLVGLVTTLLVPAAAGCATGSPAGARLLFSAAPDRSAPHALAGSSLLGNVYVFVDKPPGAVRARFFLDDPTGSGKAFHIDRRPPFDLAGGTATAALPLNTRLLADGTHIVTAVLTPRGGKTRTLRAAFTVRRLFLSPSGDDHNACTRSAPCQTLAAGFEKASSGQAIELAGGFYGCQDVRGSKTDDVLFVAAEGATAATTCELSLDAQHVAFRNVSLDGLRMSQTARFITLRNVDITCKDEDPFVLYAGHCSAGIFGAPSDFAMIGGSVGPTYDDGGVSGSPGNSQIGIPYDGGPAAATNITFDGVRFHDNRRANGAHTECLMVGGGTNVTIRGSRFQSCQVFDVFFTWWGFVSPAYPAPAKILLENNWFDQPAPDGQPAVYFGDAVGRFTNIDVRYNSALGGLQFGEGPKENVSVIGNIAPQSQSGCADGVVYAYNVWDAARCSATDRTAPSGFVDAGAFDLRLKKGAAAIDHGDPKAYPARDIFGRRRPMGRRPDAGAVEAG